MAAKQSTKTKGDGGAMLDFQVRLWAAEYKHVVLGLTFLKYISDSFEEVHAQ